MDHLAYTISLVGALTACWMSIRDSGRVLSEAASKAAIAQDLPGVGDARFEFELNLLLTPLAGVAIYGGIRLLIWLIVIGSARLRTR